MKMKVKFIKKYMRMAHFIAHDQPVCPSRQIGAIIVDPTQNKVVGTGYNGPPPGTPHTNTRVYFEEYLWPQLTDDDITSIRTLYDSKYNLSEVKKKFIDDYADEGVCPRRLLKVPSGRRMNLCSCGHAEVNAIINAAQNLRGCILFLWETGPCVPCTHAIIMAGIIEIHTLRGDLYAKESQWLLEQVDIDWYTHKAEWIFEN